MYLLVIGGPWPKIFWEATNHRRLMKMFWKNLKIFYKNNKKLKILNKIINKYQKIN